MIREQLFFAHLYIFPYDTECESTKNIYDLVYAERKNVLSRNKRKQLLN